MRTVGWTYEKAPAGAAAEGLEGFMVHRADGEVLGRVVTVLYRGGELFLAVSLGTPPLTGPVVAVPWREVRDVDYDALEIDLDRREGEYAELDDGKAVEQGTGTAEAVRVTEIPGGPPPPSAAESAPIYDRGRALLLGLGSVFSLFLFLPVLALAEASDATWPLVLLAMPLVGVVGCAVLFVRTRRAPYHTPRTPD